VLVKEHPAGEDEDDGVTGNHCRRRRICPHWQLNTRHWLSGSLPACIVTHKLFIYKQTCQQRCYYLQKLQFV